MKKRFLACLALLLLHALHAPAVEPASPRLPEPLVLHARIASPAQSLQDLDALVVQSIKDTPLADRVFPGMVSLFLPMASPLPPSAWDVGEEAHFLALLSREETLEFAFVVGGHGLDRVAEALSGNEQSREGEDGSVLVAMLKKEGPRVWIRELGDGRLLITKSAAASEHFRSILETWEPRLDSGAPIACRVDLAAIQSLSKIGIAGWFAKARENLDKQLRKMTVESEATEDGDDSEALLKKLGANAIPPLTRLINSIEAELPSLGEIGFDLDFREGRLLATASLAATGDSYMGELIAGYAETPNPDFPFIEAFPEDAIYYVYQMPPPEKTGARINRFLKETIDEIFADASPGTAADLTRLVDGLADAGRKAMGSGAYVTEEGDLLPATYIEWERPENVIPLIRDAAALLARLHGEGAIMAEEQIRKARERKKNAGKTDDEGDDEPKIGRDIEDFLAAGGARELLKPVFQSDDGERYGVPYASLAVDVNFKQMFLNAPENMPDSLKALVDRLENSLKFFWALADRTIVFSRGDLDLDDMEADLAELMRRLDGNGEGGANLGEIPRDAWLETVAASRQSVFSLIRPSRGFALLLLDYANRIAPNDASLLLQAWEVFKEVEDGDAFFYVWSGVNDDRLQFSLAMPAEGIAEMVRNGYALQYKVVALVSRFVATMRNRR